MADTMKFGPQWLRTLSDGGNVSALPASTKYKLAEHRYGREEMLALLCELKEVPKEIQEIPSIAVEEPQKPLALVPISEDEQRLMSQSVNSGVALRMMGRPSGGPPAPSLGSRGRGGPSDRGRGRGRGRGDGYYPRGPYEEDGFGRGRHMRESWEEDQLGFEHGSSGFGSRGRGNNYEENKPFHRSMSSDNWRESRKDNEEDDSGDWRRAGPSRERSWAGNRSWRDNRGGFDQENSSDRRGFDDYHRNTFDREKPSFRRSRSSGNYDDDFEGGSLPEWSTADTNDMDELGTFDASGAFMSMNLKGKEIKLSSRSDNDADDANEFWDDVVEEKEQEKQPSPPKDTADEDKPIEAEKNLPESPKLSSKESSPAERVQESPPAAQPSPELAPEQTEQPVEEEADFDHLEKAAQDLVADLASEEEEKPAAITPEPVVGTPSTALPKDHEDAKKWFYRDPQGDLQGPFASSEMAEWFSAGYFTMNLLVKRGCDEVFQPLGDLIKTWGGLPFLASSSPPPPSVPQERAPVASIPSQTPAEGEQLKAFLHQQALAQQQALMQQQQALMQQMQLQQIMQHLQQQEAFTKMSVQQQQQLAMQLLLRPQVSPMGLIKPPEQKISPSNQEELAAMAARAGMQWPPASLPSASTAAAPAPTAAGAAPGGAWAKPPLSVWDIENSNKAEENAIERARKEAELQKQKEEEEARKRREEEERQREIERQKEIERQQEAERQRALERQRELERRQELERQRLDKLRQENEEARQRQQMEEERRRAAEEKRRQEEAMRIQREEEEKRRKQVEMELQKQEEFRRRQEKAEELKRQLQFEAARRMQQEQLSNIQLPSHVRWGSNSQQSMNSAMSLAEIQELEAQTQREQQEQMEVQRQIAQIEQQQQQQAQQQQQRSWASHAATKNSSNAPSLLDIQQEEAEKEKKKKKQAPVNNKPAEMPLSSAAAWGSSNPSSTWATEGTWGNKPSGFWEEPTQNTKKKQSHVNNTHFPALNSSSNSGSQPSGSSKSKTSKTKKEEEAVQRLFQANKPQDDFTRWCESSLKGLQTSVDVPTFVAFLKDVESPYEVADYVRSYLGDSPSAGNFAKEFIEKRSRHKSLMKQAQQEESMWGPAPAVNPNKGSKANVNNGTLSVNNNKEAEFEEMKNKKKKKKMQKLDASSLLGFTVQADPDRVNIGEIDTGM